jgi:Uma2 family endonuclease
MNFAQPLSAPIRVGSKSNGMSMTPEEFDAIEEWDENFRYELVRGVLIVKDYPVAAIRACYDELGHCFHAFCHQVHSGAATIETLPDQEVRTGDNRWRTDRAVWINVSKPFSSYLVTPSIVIDFVPSPPSEQWRRTFMEKGSEFRANGVGEYWVIDHFRRTMTVFRGRETFGVVREGEVYRTELLPGFELPLTRLLKRADRYADEA